jgi:N-sulfoglucosamine sulfohydrolase
MIQYLTRWQRLPWTAGFLCILTLVPSTWAESQLPNVVLFLADDLSWSDCSVYGDAKIPTPHMERLAKAGTTFTHAFVASPSCAPSRAALLTGLDPARNGAMFNHTLPDKTHKRWPKWFQELGYEVVAFGKVAHYATVTEYGFDHASHYRYHQDDCTEAAVAWVENRKSDKPLCLLVGTNWPHVPWPKQSAIAPDAVTLPPTQVDTPETRQARAHYAAAVTNADRDLGLVYDAARQHLGDNTLFLFTSDHGSQFPFGKWNCYDEGLRTPLIAAWPGNVASATRSDALVSWVDLLPTCLEAAGGTAPPFGSKDGELSGRSFLGVLTGERTEHRQRVFAAHSGDGRMNEYPMRAVRSRDWKYIRNLTPQTEHHTHIDRAQGTDGKDYWSSWERVAATDAGAAAKVKRYHQRPEEELYDLAADPWEQLNLAANPAHAQRLSEMRGEVDAWMKDNGDKGLDTEDARRPKPRPASQGRNLPPPNIIVVLADDFGWGDVGCYGSQTPTPQLDRMAREGTRYSQCYVAAPICSPSRAGLITGQFPARWRITSFLQTRKGNRDCEQADFLDPQAPSLPRTLKAAGYATAHIGKWHLGGGRDVTDAPKFADYGYDLGLGTWESPEPHPDITASDWIWSPQDKVPRWDRTAWMVDQTLTFLADHPDQPSFVNLWLDDTHTPWVPGADELDGEKPRRPNGEANFRRVLIEMDRQVGRLLDGLAKMNSDRGTLVIFLGDNGPLPTFELSRTAGLRGSKLSLYEGGIRVPCIAWWPGQVPADKVNEELVLSAIDFFPTLCAIAGAKLPADYAADGENLAGALLGNKALRTKPLYWEYGRNERAFAYPKEARQRSPNVAIRDGQWKLLVNVDGSAAQLFDLSADPKETMDVAAGHPEVAVRLNKLALDWRKSLPGKPPSK